KVYDLLLKCTYEGCRQVKGQQQAVIGLVGVIKSRETGAATGGKVVGQARFAVEQGYFSEAKLTVETDIEDGKLVLSQEVNLSRTPGNTYGIAPTMAKRKVILQEDHQLGERDAADYPGKPGCHYKAHTVMLTQGQTYVIEMNKRTNERFDPYLVV